MRSHAGAFSDAETVRLPVRRETISTLSGDYTRRDRCLDEVTLSVPTAARQSS